MPCRFCAGSRLACNKPAIDCMSMKLYCPLGVIRAVLVSSVYRRSLEFRLLQFIQTASSHLSPHFWPPSTNRDGTARA